MKKHFSIYVAASCIMIIHLLCACVPKKIDVGGVPKDFKMNMGIDSKMVRDHLFGEASKIPDRYYSFLHSDLLRALILKVAKQSHHCLKPRKVDVDWDKRETATHFFLTVYCYQKKSDSTTVQEMINQAARAQSKIFQGFSFSVMGSIDPLTNKLDLNFDTNPQLVPIKISGRDLRLKTVEDFLD